jgi:hypothetical protein
MPFGRLSTEGKLQVLRAADNQKAAGTRDRSNRLRADPENYLQVAQEPPAQDPQPEAELPPATTRPALEAKNTETLRMVRSLVQCLQVMGASESFIGRSASKFWLQFRQVYS